MKLAAYWRSILTTILTPTTREWITLDADGNMVFPEISEQKGRRTGRSF